MASLFSPSEKPIGLCSDHGGFATKSYIIQLLEEKGIPYQDFGTHSTESCDYPDFAHKLATAVENGECYPGIAICTTGNGINMTVNKHKNIRAALCWSPEIAHFARAHNDANILSLPGGYVDEEQVYQILITFLNTSFEGGRHERRVNKIPL